MSVLSNVGTALWVLFVLSPLVVIVQQIRRFQSKRPYSWQPIQGERSVVLAHANEPPSLAMLLLCQLALIGGSIAALAINDWGSYEENWGNYYEADLGLITYTRSSGTTAPMTCALDLQYTRSMYYPRISYVVTGAFLTGTECFTIVGSSILVFIFMIISILIALYQFALMQPWINFRSCVVVTVPIGGVGVMDELSAVTPGLWARGYIYMVLQGSMCLLYGICASLCGGVFPGISYWVLLAVAALSRLQYFLLEIYIKALPPPHPGGQIGFPQCEPKPVVASIPAINVAAPNVPAAALEMSVVPAPSVSVLQQHAAPYGYNPFYYNAPAYVNWGAAARFPAPIAGAVSQPPVALHLEGPSVSPATSAAVAQGVPVVAEGEGAAAANRYAVSSAIPAGVAPNTNASSAAGGTPAAALTPRFVRVCGRCNSNERDGAAFCSSCGSRMTQ